MNLSNLPLSIKGLFTGYILVIGVGLMMAGAQIMLTHGASDGKVGLSIDDVVYSYYGNRSNSTLENKLNGSMKDKASEQDRKAIIHWVKKGADEQAWKTDIKPIVASNCAACHANIATLPNLTNYAVIKELAKTESSVDISSLTRISHIHLFGIAFIFFFVGLIFSLATGFNEWLKILIIFTPFAFLLLDVSAWWLTRLDPAFAWLVIIGGVGYSLASTVMLSTSLYQMWILPWQGKISNVDAWHKNT
ncbi:elongation factor-1 alpha [Bathymodiolus septemdierum thioautotrophic gill symbiont]|uniref:Elongation factor-1 alpha n=1 Tax=endosymbiont of Bathymodiolus septemdierum str. Myojin knoll TaxID=1303921 RepID=A0A0P0UR65_9GAMM|nr:elongation factor-1 alpha [Bathymodiolus septemdierum thioautotrophic gill symbiont]BAS67258.1 conserved hypothetical protein [endosymbiont of Bathymodiolus septemdierum str. Myojin knoll]